MYQQTIKANHVEISENNNFNINNIHHRFKSSPNITDYDENNGIIKRSSALSNKDLLKVSNLSMSLNSVKK